MRWWRWVLILGATACAGELELRYGETLCDSAHPCSGDRTCVEGVCVAGASGDQAAGDTAGFGDWDSGDTTFHGDVEYCRVDDQCGPGRVCARGVCMVEPCYGVDLPGCDDPRECRVRCRPTDQSCAGVACTDNVEYCLHGGCVPMCTFDPCDVGGCLDGTPNCLLGECSNGYFCLNGICEGSSVNLCSPDNTCDPGFDCLLTCVDPAPCAPNPCNSGWYCQDLGGGDYTCHEIACSGVICPPGQRCENGECKDPCVGRPCAEGGNSDSCPPDSVCCGIPAYGHPDPQNPDPDTLRKCCPADFLCRNNECVPPDCVNPDCEDDETCMPDGCYCGPVPSWEICAANECCFTTPVTPPDPDTGQCVDPCVPNNCPFEDPVEYQGCVPNCSLPGGYECVDLCQGITCTLPDTCDPATGSCSCGGDFCVGNECCVSNACHDVCQENPGSCPRGGDPATATRCVPDCDQTAGFACVDPCTDGGDACTELRNPDCTENGDTAVCYCDLDPTDDTCTAAECCVSGVGCAAPCSSPLTCPKGGDPATFTACAPDLTCVTADGYTCSDPCAGRCAAPRNPDCRRLGDTYECYCDLDPTDDTCNGTECCIAGKGCAVPCTNDLTCPKAGQPATYTACTPNCSDADGYTCSDACGVCNVRNPDCQPDGMGGVTCYCDDDPTDDTCNASECCVVGLGCEVPCTGALTCPKGGQPAGYTRCTVNCSDPDGYTCADPCAGRCTGVQNPDCRSPDGSSFECFCDVDPTDEICTGQECCVAGYPGCVDPCATFSCPKGGDPGTYTRCNRNCSNVDGYTCSDPCAGQCTADRNPDCERLGDTHRCYCEEDPTNDTCGASECCVVGVGCKVPCDAAAIADCNSQGGLICVTDCSEPDGYRCDSLCGPSTCTGNDNSHCNPANGQCYCDASFTVQCAGGSSCCVGSSCTNPCSPNPCVNPDPLCSPSCGPSSDYTCGHACTDAQCASNPLAPDCDPAVGCRCGTSAPCTGNDCCISGSCQDPCAGQCTTSPDLRCTRQCGTPPHYACDDACDPDPCVGNSQADGCDHATGNCLCGASPECTGTELCCTGVCHGPVGSPSPCTTDPNCAYDPCIGCYQRAELDCLYD